MKLIKFDRSHSSLCIIFIVVLLIVSLLFFVSPYITVIGTKGTNLKNELNNKYIDNDYDGWKTERIDGKRTLSVPENWNILVKDDFLSIIDTNGEILAEGKILRAPFGPNDVIAVYQGIVPFPIVDYESIDLTPSGNLSYSSYYELLLYGEENMVRSFYEVCLFLPEAECVVLFDKSVSSINIELIEAICYSYHITD